MGVSGSCASSFSFSWSLQLGGAASIWRTGVGLEGWPGCKLFRCMPKIRSRKQGSYSAARRSCGRNVRAMSRRASAAAPVKPSTSAQRTSAP